MRNLSYLLAGGLLALLLSGCGTSSSDSHSNTVSGAAGPEISVIASPSSTSVILDGGDQGSVVSPMSPASPSPSETSAANQSDSDQTVKKSAQEIIDILRSRDLERLAKVTDPEQGLRFSPFAHIDSETTQLFKPDGLPSFKETDKLVWGSFDGSGEPIELTFREYFEKFVYDQDFASAPSVNVNKLIGQGNVPFNGHELYPDASYVEFHYPGFDKKNEGMDWESLILVLQPDGDDWKLCAIVHAQWTI